MLRTLRWRFVLLAGFLVSCAVQSSVAAESSLRRLVSPELLGHANLKILWEKKLPIRETENLERLLILDDRIYAISDRNYIASLNRENGNVIFSRTTAPAGLLIAGLRLYGDELLSIGGSKLIEIDAESGIERKATDVGYSIACPAARNSSYFYLSGADRRLYVLRAANKVQVFEVAAENESMITSVVADDSKNFSWHQVEVAVVEGGNLAIALGEIATFENRFHYAVTFLIHWSTVTAPIMSTPMRR